MQKHRYGTKISHEIDGNDNFDILTERAYGDGMANVVFPKEFIKEEYMYESNRPGFQIEKEGSNEKIKQMALLAIEKNPHFFCDRPTYVMVVRGKVENVQL